MVVLGLKRMVEDSYEMPTGKYFLILSPNGPLSRCAQTGVKSSLRIHYPKSVSVIEQIIFSNLSV